MTRDLLLTGLSFLITITAVATIAYNPWIFMDWPELTGIFFATLTYVNFWIGASS